MKTRTQLHRWERIQGVLREYGYIDENNVVDVPTLKKDLIAGKWRHWRNFGPASLQALMVNLDIKSIEEPLRLLPARCQQFLANANLINDDGSVDMAGLRAMLIECPNKILCHRGVGKGGLAHLYRFAAVPDPVEKPTICPCCKRPL